MGQYHQICAPTLNSCMQASNMGGFVKAVEQAWNTDIGSGLGILCATGFAKINPYAALLNGAWAQAPIFLIGDYAEDGDLIGHPGLQNIKEDAFYAKDSYPAKKAKAGFARKTCVAASMLPIFETLFGARYVATSWGSSTCVQHVVQNANGDWEIDRAAFESDKDYQEYCDYIDRMTDKSGEWKRPLTPIKGVASPIDPNAAAAQDPGLWISLDAGEYIDPVELGAKTIKDTFENEAINFALVAMLAHPFVRGGGDIADDSHMLAGRWRGHRLAFVGADGITIDGAHCSREAIKSLYVDVTSIVQIKGEEHDYRFLQGAVARRVLTPGDADWTATMDAIRDVLFQDIDSQNLVIQISPVVQVTPKETTITFPASVRVEKDESVFWISPETRQTLTSLAATLEQPFMLTL